MKLFAADVVLSAALLLVTSANAFSFDLSKRALKYDASCNTKYGSLTAKQLIDKSIDFQPKLAKAGKDGLDNLIAALEYQSNQTNQTKVPGAKKPKISKGELDTIIATYRVLFGDIKARNDDGSPNPNFQAEAAEHIAAIKVTRDSLNRMTKRGNPDLIIHCNDDWLSEQGPKNAAPKPTNKLKPNSKLFYDMDRSRWVSVTGGKPCQGNKATVTTMNSKLSGTKREKGAERVTFCTNFLKTQQQLEKDKQPHIWDISKTKLPETFTTYTQAGKKDETLPFHISAFGKKIGAKWFHEFMHTELFHPGHKTFSDKKLSGSVGGAYGFEGAVGLAREKGGKNIAQSSRNIETILYWSLAMYYDNWVWSTGKPGDRSSLTAPPVQARNVDEGFQVDIAAKKPPKKTDKPQDPPKTEEPKEPPKTETPPPPKTDAPAEPPKTSAAPPPPPPSSPAPSPPPPPPASSQVAPPAGSPTPPPANSVVHSTSAPGTIPPTSTQPPASKASSTNLASMPTSISSAPSNSISISASLPSSCSNTLCTLPSSSTTPTSSGTVPEETFDSEPMNAGSMTSSEILAIAESIISEQVIAMGLWDQVLTEMGLPAEPPSETVEGDATASAGTGLPMATGGAGGAANGTWSMPVLRARESNEGRGGVRERRMYDYAS